MAKFDVKFTGVEIKPRDLKKTYTVDAESEEEATFKARVMAAKEFRGGGHCVACEPNVWAGRKATLKRYDPTLSTQVVEIDKRDGGDVYVTLIFFDGTVKSGCHYYFEEIQIID